MSHFVVISWFAYESTIAGVFSTRTEALSFISEFKKEDDSIWFEHGEWPNNITASRVYLEEWQGTRRLSYETVLNDD